MAKPMPRYFEGFQKSLIEFLELPAIFTVATS